MSKTLKLTLNKQWFDMIEKGIKTEEYREIKGYWVTRLCHTTASTIINLGADLTDRHNGKSYDFKQFNFVEFTNGYSKSSRQITMQCKGIEIGVGRGEWGAIEDTQYFVILLGNEVSRLNC